MKRLFAFALALLLTVSAYAQEPDPSTAAAAAAVAAGHPDESATNNAVTATQTDAVLVIQGTRRRDVIRITEESAGTLQVTAGAKDLGAFEGVTTIVAYGGPGNDSIANESAVSSALFGGAGNDALFGSSAADWLDGGGGTNSVHGRDGNDQLIGGPTGHTFYYGGHGDDSYSLMATTNQVTDMGGSDRYTAAEGSYYLVVDVGVTGDDEAPSGNGNFVEYDPGL